MNRTVNRTPVQVSIPSSKDRYFNHIEWKGINDNKNVMGIDQQTFAEAENVYVNTEDILTSRPPITMRDKWGLEGQIVKFWEFGEYLVVQTLEEEEEDVYKLWFIFNDERQPITDNIVEENNTVILLTRKIFVLNTEQFSAYDISADTPNNERWERDATQYIYIPINDEPDNLLSKGSKRRKWVWTNNSTPPWHLLDGTEVSVLLDGEVHTITYRSGLERTFVTKFDETFMYTEIKCSEQTTDSGTPLFATVMDNFLWYSQNGIDWVKVTDTPTDFELLYVSDVGDSIFGRCKEVNVNKIALYSLNTNEWNYEPTASSKLLTICAYSEELWTGIIGITLITHKWVYMTPSSGGVTYSSVQNHPSHEDFSSIKLSARRVLFNGDIRYIAVYLCTTYFLERHLVYGLSYYDTPDVVIETGMLSSITPTFKLLDTNIYIYTSEETDSKLYIEYMNYDTAMINSDFALSKALIFDLINYPETSVNTSVIYDNNFSDINKTLHIKGVILQGTGYTTYTIPDYGPVIITSYNISDYFKGIPIYIDDNVIWSYDPAKMELYRTNAKSNIEVTLDTVITPTPMYFQHVLEWDDIILANGRELYIMEAKTDSDGVFSWYIRDRDPNLGTSPDIENFNFPITGLHLLSNNELAVFLEHEIWIVTMHQSGSTNQYTYNKSKLPIGIKQGSNIMTTFDGRYILFSCERGLVALQYQQFLATTEQALTFISDDIAYDEFNTGPIKLYQYKFWVVVYRIDRGEFFLLDMRNQSWWNWTFKQPIKDIVTYNEVPLFLSQNNLFVLGDDTNYTDDGDEIKWKITSQLLHFDAINNFKQVLSLILNSVDTEDRFVFSLQTINYRKESNTRRREVFEYDVDTIRTFIKRMQFSKVNEFQYQLRNADKSLTPVPLKLTDISIKYVITERVR